MAYKSWKPKNNNYIDGAGIRVNRKTLLDYIFPVGSIYLSISGTDPGTLFGGTWQRISQGRFLIGVKENSSYEENNIMEFGQTTQMKNYLFTVRNRGGEYKHLITELETGIREHTHALPLSTKAGVGTYTDLPYRANVSGGGITVDYEFRTGRTTALSDKPNDYGSIFINGTQNVNAVNTHNNMPPYYAIYIWERIA